jgi:hypothetical protein
MRTLLLFPLIVVFGFLPLFVAAQNFERVVFDQADSVNGYYLAVRPLSGVIRGVVVVFRAFRGPESIPPETKLHNVAAANNILTIYASIGWRLTPGVVAEERMNRLFAHVLSQYKVDSSLFAVGGFDVGGTAVLRYAELAQEHPDQYVIHPRVVFGIASPVDMGGLYRQCERQLRKNYPSPALGDARAELDLMKKEQGVLEEHADQYAQWTPFDHTLEAPGNERFLRHVAVRLYYDTDPEWQLKARRNGYYDTYLPDGSELIDRLLLQGNDRAEFVAANQPGMRSNGDRNVFAFSIVDEVDCIQWIMKELRPYKYPVPDGWRGEPYSLPPYFAPEVKFQGVEEVRLPSGWGVAGSPEYWSVALLWWLKAGQKIDAAALQENMRAYYDGLVVTGGGPVKHQIPADKMVTTKVEIRAIKTEPGDVNTYAGTVDMLDYMAMKPMRLNFFAHIRDCGDPGHIPVFLELSPKPYDDAIWDQLKELKKRFTLNN